jgi:UMP-CMP kinase
MSHSSSTYSTALAVAAGALLGAGLTYATARPTKSKKGDDDGDVYYEVNLVVDAAIKGEYRKWLEPHCKELLALPGFLDASILEDEADMPPTVLFVLGGPGAGKGTQCAKIVEKYGYCHISAGDCLRAERKDPNSKHGALINKYIREGKIVPVEITVKLLKKSMEASGKKKFLIDGFPRDTGNVTGWREHVGAAANVAGVMYFDCPENVLEARLLERGKSSGRADDNIASIKKRFRTYQETTMPIIKHYETMGMVQRFEADKTEEEVFAEVSKYIEQIDAKHCEKVRYTVNYHVKSRARLQEYFDVHAAKLRGDGINRFKGRFTATRRVLKVVKPLSAPNA